MRRADPEARISGLRPAQSAKRNGVTTMLHSTAETALAGAPVVTDLRVVPVAGHDSMLMNLSGAHGPFFTRNIVILTTAPATPASARCPAARRSARPSRTRACSSSASRIGALQRGARSDAHARSPTATPAAAACRPSTCASTIHARHGGRVGAARPARPAPRRAGGRRCSAKASSATRVRDAGLPLLRRRPDEDRPALSRASGRATTTGRACATRRR